MIVDNFQVAAEWRSRCCAGIVNTIAATMNPPPGSGLQGRLAARNHPVVQADPMPQEKERTTSMLERPAAGWLPFVHAVLPDNVCRAEVPHGERANIANVESFIYSIESWRPTKCGLSSLVARAKFGITEINPVTKVAVVICIGILGLLAATSAFRASASKFMRSRS